MLIPFSQLFERYRIKPPGVLHLGAHHGQEADAYRLLGVKKVIWVEAVPDIYLLLAKRMQAFPEAVCLMGCLSNRDGETVQFHVANNGQSSSLLELGTHKQAHPEVRFTRDIPMETIRPDTLLRQNGFDHPALFSGWMLNVDLQGAELLALEGLGAYLPQFGSVYIEVNEKPLYVGCPLIADIDAYLGKSGFTRVETKMSGKSGWGDALYISC